MSSDSPPKRPKQAPMLCEQSGRTRTIPDYRALSGSTPKKSNPTHSQVVSDSRTAPVEARTVPGPSTNITPVTPPIFANISQLHDAAKRLPSSTPGGSPGSVFGQYSITSIMHALSLYATPADAWEGEINPWLDQHFGVWAMGWPGAIQKLVNQISVGPHGLDGFIEILQWLVGNGYTVDAMLGGKVDNIIHAIDFVVGSSSRPASPSRTSMANSSHDVRPGVSAVERHSEIMAPSQHPNASPPRSKAHAAEPLLDNLSLHFVSVLPANTAMPTAPKRGVKPRVNAAKQHVGIMAPSQSPIASLPASAPTDILFHDLSPRSRPASQSSHVAPTSSTAPKRGISPEQDSHMLVKEPAKKKHRGGKLSKGKIKELALKKKEFLQYLEEKGDEWGHESQRESSTFENHHCLE
ncbi:uncharacterized protein EI90DRAFT_3206121 [Cantharellus anzutake]|uniref:uncharacterized protein n=1 Tax=Cantharellus anzutake TaxID=1750568 RepID=UPI001904C1B5|nr:uncharacterized protein EI90DRAFT_3206121 [Cantharellus anzutake]KAF8330018.1 hypothetical protein EI90DRAFT_3206121 [Cantharellus anzutake]